MKYISANSLLLGVLSISISITSSWAFSAPAPRKLFLAFDGSGNNARDQIPTPPPEDKDFTNVLKLLLLAGGSIENTSSEWDDQICLYERGVGAQSRIESLKKLRFYLGDLSQQTEHMTEALEKVYQPGDELYMIGFSRGSASCREFAVQLNNEGLKASNGEPVPIKFMGCFDTVSMQVKENLVDILKTELKKTLTKASVVDEPDGKIPANVAKAVHHVSLDDNRFAKGIPFPPVLMDSADDRVHEAWFPGQHGDVGGNYYTKGVPDNSCQAMKDMLEKEGIKFYDSPSEIKEERLVIDGYPGKHIDPETITIVPDLTMEAHIDPENESPRPVVCATNDDDIIEGATVKINKGVLEHLEAFGDDYPINEEILKANIVVVDNLQKPLGAETKKLNKLLDAMGAKELADAASA